MRRRSENCVSDLRLDQLSSGELTSDERAELSRHLSGCAGCRQRQSELEGDRLSFSQRAPAFDQLMKPRAPARPLASASGAAPSSRRRGLVVAASALAAAAAIALGIGVASRPARELAADGEPGAWGVTRTKGGGPSLGFVLRRGQRVSEGQPDQIVHPGDALRFTVTSSRPVYVLVAGADATGTLSVYHPQDERPSQVAAGQRVPLSSAVELDATLGEEVILAVFCDAPVAPAELARALAASPSAPPLPPGCVHQHWSLHKEAP